MFFNATVQVNSPRRLPLTIRRNDNPWRAKFRLFDHMAAPLDMRAHRARLQLRLYKGMPGLPNLAVSTPIYSYWLGSDGIQRTFSGGETWVTRDARGLSDIVMTADGFDIAIDAKDILEVPVALAIGEPVRLSYDILVTTPAGDENAWFEGEATVLDGVTRPLTDADRDALNQAYFEVHGSM